jgi:hypothetical protein
MPRWVAISQIRLHRTFFEATTKSTRRASPAACRTQCSSRLSATPSAQWILNARAAGLHEPLQVWQFALLNQRLDNSPGCAINTDQQNFGFSRCS